MRIGKLAESTGISRDAIRHYLELGLITARRDPDNGYQEFGSDAQQRINFIRTARELGFRLEEIAGIFHKADQGASPCSEVRTIVSHRITETRQKIAELQQLCDRMEDALQSWEQLPDSRPDSSHICALIESQQE